MGKKVTFGGKRLGSGGGIDLYMDGYHASNHDLGFVFRSTMDCGTLVPFCKLPMIIGDNFDIDTKALIKTLPTGAPSFGRFKYQIDWFFCPNRLYMGPLHNNATGIGMKMGNVLLPTIKFPIPAKKFTENMEDPNQTQVAPDSLVAYMGIRGFGENRTNVEQTREFNGIPFLAYPDIFKNFYANQQEQNAYMIGYGTSTPIPQNSVDAQVEATESGTYYPTKHIINETPYEAIIQPQTDWVKMYYEFQTIPKNGTIQVTTEEITNENAINTIIPINNNTPTKINGLNNVIATAETLGTRQEICVTFSVEPTSQETETFYIGAVAYLRSTETATNYKITPFPLENIDKARDIILSNPKIGSKVSIGTTELINFSPYVEVTQKTIDNVNACTAPKSGLLLRTYMGDIYNNWVRTDWIEEINNATMVKTNAAGSFSMDALVVAKRAWEYRNKVAVSGGTYQDWMEATYGRNAQAFCESPIYMGGASGTIAFDEVVSTAGQEDLGELGGRGVSFNHKGGKINVKAQEIGYLIGIISIVPYVDYYQGNDWDMSELINMESYHMPEFDGLGFQDLITERLAAWDTKIQANGKLLKKSVGKQPAWSQYMSNHNKVFGDFCKKEGGGQFEMVITREYQPVEGNNGIEIKDLTTYVMPDMYNYLFVSKQLEYNPFWVQIACDIFARRLMSAAVMPHL